MSSERSLSLLSDLVADAKRAGADAVEAVWVDQTSLGVGWRLGALEHLERSESSDIGLRVLIGKRQALVSSSDQSKSALAELVDRAVSMARVVPEDPYIGFAEPDQLATSFPDLDLYDPTEPSAETLIDLAGRGVGSAPSPSVSNL